jgi:hypothetical protein
VAKNSGKKSKEFAAQQKGAAPTKVPAPEKTEIRAEYIRNLHLDRNNPRFGMMAGRLTDEAQILDFIVEQFGVQDVLSSIAVNGYFNSEPILAKRERRNGPLIVAEGNRRLVACLILGGDERAKNQSKRMEEFRKIHEQYGRKPFDPVPIIVFETREELGKLLPYLGVRHIAGAQEWDSYAKAAWVAQAIERQDLKLDDVIHMIGDDTRLARRMLGGYYVVRQLVENGHFNPAETQKKGTKSNADFPFSWVYTALGYSTVGDWIGMPSEPKKDPLDRNGIERAGQLFRWMFGQGKSTPAITESRDIGDLARSLDDPEKMRLLRAGKNIEEVLQKTRAPSVQISDGLTTAHEELSGVLTIIGEGSVTATEASECVPLSNKVRSLSRQVHRDLERVAGFGENDDA